MKQPATKVSMILCCGEALIDMIPSPTEVGRPGFVPFSGGAIFNTAIALGRLGAPVGMLSGISTDVFGQQLVSDLLASHVDISWLIRSDRPTTLAFVRLTNGQASYTFFDENSAGRMVAAGDLPVLPDRVLALCFGGISLCVEPAADAYAALCAREADRRIIMLDPNIRRGFILNEAGYRARLERMIGQADIVKVSDEDLDWLYPTGAGLAAGLRRIKAAGPRLVVATRGAEGAVALLPDGSEVAVTGVKADVVDTVGAGDTFNAGLLAALGERGLLSPEHLDKIDAIQAAEALRFACQVASVTVARAGANPPWRHELGVGAPG